MRSWSIPVCLILACLAPTLQAQDPHFGFGLNLVFPTGEYSSHAFPSYVQPGVNQTDRYDLGLGGQFTISFPVDPKVAIRMDIAGHAANGVNREPGYDDINLRHQILSLGGEIQVFPGMGSAFTHQGTYLLGGVSADFESFDHSFGDPGWDYTETTRKSRMGGIVGVGHSFGYNNGLPRFTLEGTFHKTLTGNDIGAGDPPSTDFATFSFGWVF